MVTELGGVCDARLRQVASRRPAPELLRSLECTGYYLGIMVLELTVIVLVKALGKYISTIFSPSFSANKISD